MGKVGACLSDAERAARSHGFRACFYPADEVRKTKHRNRDPGRYQTAGRLLHAIGIRYLTEMVFRIDFRKYLFDISLAVYDERGAQNTHVFSG